VADPSSAQQDKNKQPDFFFFVVKNIWMAIPSSSSSSFLLLSTAILLVLFAGVSEAKIFRKGHQAAHYRPISHLKPLTSTPAEDMWFTQV
jgi:hypothetical protein